MSLPVLVSRRFLVVLVLGFLTGGLAPARGQTQPAAREGPSAGQPSDSRAPVAKAKPKQKPPVAPKPVAAKDAVPRYTNEDLPPLRDDEKERNAEQEAEDGSVSRSLPKGDSGGEEGEGSGAVGKASEKTVIDAEAAALRREELNRAIPALQERLAYLEARKRSLQNPLLAGVTPAHDDENAAVGGKSGAARIAWVDEQIALARTQVEEARAELAALPSPGR